jgi:hypothetical protein
MSAQTTYGFATPKGVAGGLLDLAPYSIDSRINEETVAGALLFGMGVVQGTSAGVGVIKPVAESTADAFEGITMTGFNTQQTIEGAVNILPNQSVGVLRYGKAWARIVKGQAPKYGDKLFLVISGDNAGLFTTAADVTNTKIEVRGRFAGAKGTGDVAPIELFNQSNAAENAAV